MIPMNAQFLVFFTVFLSVYSLANFYVGLRGWQAFHSLPAFPGGRFYSVVFILVAFAYILERILGDYLPGPLNTLLAVGGGVWMAALYYLTLFCLLFDLLRLANRLVGFVPANWRLSPTGIGGGIVLIVACILAYGAWNATHTVWRSYEIELDKTAGDLQELRIVMVSDIHLGKVIDNHRLQFLVDQINARRPDLVLLAGDVIDEDIGHFIDQDMASTFRKLQSRFGVFAVLGNHEYIGRETEAAIELMRSGGITVLRDSYFIVENRFVIAGRDDWDRQRFLGSPRQPLTQWLQGIDPALPLFLMDHQPRELAAALAAGVDLTVSGHTHRGQLYPNHWVTQRLYEIDWGYLQKGSLHAIVSSGFGTWGPPVRTSAKSEIVEIKVKFRQSKK